MTDKDLAKHLTSLSDLQNNRNKAFNDWLRNIITISIGFLAIIVSLKSNKSETCLQNWLFIITVVSNAIGILFGLIVLFGDVVVLNLSLKVMKEQILKLLDEANLEFDTVPRPKIYVVLEYICFSSLIISLISLTFYAVLSSL